MLVTDMYTGRQFNQLLSTNKCGDHNQTVGSSVVFNETGMK